MLDHGWYTWFGPIVAWGELLVGIGMILGHSLVSPPSSARRWNFNSMLAGSASTNRVLFFLAILLIQTWKVSGHFGVDRSLLPRLGILWTPPERPTPNSRRARPQTQQTSWFVN
jgi:thiosulfate dehydrogenase (quinone) large subunit